MSKVDIVSKVGESLDLAVLLQDEGHNVTFHCLSKHDDDIGDGIVRKSNTLGDLHRSDLIINDDVYLGGLSDTLRKDGKLVIGGSIPTDKMENDREFGAEIMQKSGIAIPPTEKFTSFEKARKYIQNRPKRYVFKPHGQKERFLTHCAIDAEDMLLTMKHFEKIWNGPVAFELQDFVEGIEMAAGGWFNGKDILFPYLVSFEHKKLCDGDLGPNTGELGTALIYMNRNKFFDETIAKVVPFLRTTGYVGYVDLNCIVTPNVAYGLEWTMRFGYPTISIQAELHLGKWFEFFTALARGETFTVPVAANRWCVGVVFCNLPWPLQNNSDKFKDRPIFFPKDRSHIHFSDIKKDADGYKQAGVMGFLCVVDGSDPDLREAKRKAYAVIKQIRMSGGFYRHDIGDRVMKELPTIKSWGWL